MTDLFIKIRILDVIDILLVAYLMFQVYLLIRGTSAMTIFIGILSVYLVWILVKVLNMQLLGTILGQVIGVGVIALIVVFQQEIRRFLIFIGNRYMKRNRLTFEKVFPVVFGGQPNVKIKSVIKACMNMAKSKTGALIVIGRKSDLAVFAETGDIIDANTSSRLLESIFNKNSPLHDGAVIIINDRIAAARCVLPVSDNHNLPASYGLRHRAGLGMSEQTDSIIIIVSEQTGFISLAEHGNIYSNIDLKELTKKLEREYA
jgi:diadenylate cyclase